MICVAISNFVQPLPNLLATNVVFCPAAPFFLVIVPDPRETAETAETVETAETGDCDAIGVTVGYRVTVGSGAIVGSGATLGCRRIT